MNTETWIKMSERKPGEVDYPIACGYYDGLHQFCQFFAYSGGQDLKGGIYWRSVKAPPPPRELTQREKDHQADRLKMEALWSGSHESFRLNADLLCDDVRQRFAREILAALETQVIKRMNEAAGHYFAPEWFIAALAPIRARLEEQGAK